MPTQLPSFSLPTAGATRTQNAYSFPSGRPTLLCFVKEDCPTTRISMHLLQKAFEEFSAGVHIVALAQNVNVDLVLTEQFSMTPPFLDESPLHASYAYEIETVPPLVLATPA